MHPIRYSKEDNPEIPAASDRPDRLLPSVTRFRPEDIAGDHMFGTTNVRVIKTRELHTPFGIELRLRGYPSIGIRATNEVCA